MHSASAPAYGRAVPSAPAAGGPSRLIGGRRRLALGVLAPLLSVLLVAGQPRPAAAGGDGTGDCYSVTTCYTPQQIEVAYGIWPLLLQGFDGRGETVVMPELAEQQLDPPMVSDIRQDLAGFDQRFGLPAARLEVTTRFAPGASRWLSFYEETLDVEMVHAIAPSAAIDVVLFSLSATASAGSVISNLTDMVRLGTAHGDVISMSEGIGENCAAGADVSRLHAALRAADLHHVTVIASSGDTGPVGGPCLGQFVTPGAVPPRAPSLPASDPLVLAVGGTSLTASHQDGGYTRETAWSLPLENRGLSTLASGGGFSHRFPRPAYQNGVPGIGGARGVPDVAADASGHTGMALVISNGSGGYEIGAAGGTSAAAPFWAGLIAVADQFAGHDLGFVNPALYCIGRSPVYHQAFHDVTTGNSTVMVAPNAVPGYRAGPGWDPVTGWGTPSAQAMVPLLAGYACY
jgi:subtilase family serine protease